MEPSQTPPSNQPVNNPAMQPPYVPSSWSGAFGLYKYSKEAVKLNFWTLATFFLLSTVLGFVLEDKLGLVGSVISILLSTLASVAYVLAFVAGVRGQRMPVGEAFSKSWPYIIKMFLLTILVTASLVLSLLLLLIPFFFVLPRLSLANYFLVDKNMGVLDAYKASWNATKGHALKVWGIYGVNFLFVLLMLTIIGIPFAIYFVIMYSAATAVLYELLNRNPALQAVQAAQAPQAEPQPSSQPTPADQPQPTAEPQTNPEPPTNPAPPSN